MKIYQFTYFMMTIVALISFVFPTQAQMNILDDFNDGYIDYTLWKIVTKGDAQVIEGSGYIKLLSENGGDTNDAAIINRYRIFGDFEVEIDYEVINIPEEGKSRFGLALSNESQSFQYKFYYQCLGLTAHELTCEFIDSTGVPIYTRWYTGTMYPVGKLKVVNKDGSIACYFWRDNDWYDLSTIYYEINGLFLELYTSTNENFPPYEYHFDNFKLIADSLAYTLMYDYSISPKILMVKDIPNDQGKQVRASWIKSSLDGVKSSDSTVIEYSLWRRIDDLPDYLVAMVNKESIDLKTNSSTNFDMNHFNDIFSLLSDQLPPGKWDFIRTIPAIGSNTYNVVAHTLADSTITHGMRWSVFSIIAHTANSLIFFVSEPDSGYSLDNLIPHSPSGLLAIAGDSNITLTWEMVPDEDFNYYSIYRSIQRGFNPTTMKPYATTTDTFFTDMEINTSIQYYYIVSAIDFSGNEGEFSDEVSAIITGVNDHTPVPKSYTLFQNFPNPFNPTTTIEFDLPKTSEVTLKIYNINGEEVVTLVSDRLSTGNHAYKWDASNIASGVYLYRLEAGEYVETRKMVLMR